MTLRMPREDGPDGGPRSVMRGGVIACISGPSGVGKGTVIRALQERVPGLLCSVSVTTRAPRPGEEEGKAYYFRSRACFMEMLGRDDILEYDHYCDNYYGTPRRPLEDAVREGRSVLLDITVKGSLTVKAKLPKALTIFLLPPSLDALYQRLSGRGTEDADVVQARLEVAKQEIRRSVEFDYILVNDSLKQTVDDLEHILFAERCRRENLQAFEDYLENL